MSVTVSWADLCTYRSLVLLLYFVMVALFFFWFQNVVRCDARIFTVWTAGWMHSFILTPA